MERDSPNFLLTKNYLIILINEKGIKFNDNDLNFNENDKSLIYNKT